MKIESAKQDIENEFEDYSEQKRETGKELKEKQKLVDDMKNNRKSYSENLRSARSSLERKLSDLYGRTIKVQILADLFVCGRRRVEKCGRGPYGKAEVFPDNRAKVCA